MAIYKKLSFAAGGGVISTTQQADQVENTATILIGLGGTGIDCLRTIKTQVYSRLKPDDEDSVEKTYKHIRFLGIDTDKKYNNPEEYTGNDDTNQLALESAEVFPIANPNLRDALYSVAASRRNDIKWLNPNINAPDVSMAGAGGVRQVGRFLMMDQSTAFISKIQALVHSAKEGLTDSVSLNIHVFSGLSGGTGSGAFLDACYLIRKAVENESSKTIYGYFFLPDVNLEKISLDATLTREYIPKNGFAALQELDYCMHLQHNGGWFEQEYKDHTTISWNCGPVDMCHLICATNSAGHVIPEAYDYAMHVTAEYVLDFLTKSEKFGIESNLANFHEQVQQANGRKSAGFYLDYCVIGAACARLPLREINTYLASELFDKFSKIGGVVPDKADVEKLAIASMGPSSSNLKGVYDALWREIYNDATDGFRRFEDHWRNVINNDEAMIDFYVEQRAAKENLVRTGAKSMASGTNQKSLIGRLRSYLEKIICDIEKGPVFAHRMLSSSETNNLLNVIDGLITQNEKLWVQELGQERKKEYEEARDRFHNRIRYGMFDNDKKRYTEYRYRVEAYVQHQFWLFVFENLNDVLKEFRKQVVQLEASYYSVLSRVTNNLIETFKENRGVLQDPEMMKNKDAFAEPLVTIEEIKGTLKDEVEKQNISGLLDAFMRMLLDNSEKWINEEESEIAKLVTDFMVKQAFKNFASKSITQFLHEKYQTSTDSELAVKVYNEWMRKLTDKASPLFYHDANIWSNDDAGHVAYLSFPQDSGPVAAAANKMYEDSNKLWSPKASNLTDRIYVMRSGCGVPLAAYKNCSKYEQSYFNSVSVGRHYYEGGIEGMVFDDWRQMPSLTPRSLLNTETIPDPLKTIVETAEGIYDQAIEYHLLSSDNVLLKPTKTGLENIKNLLIEINNVIEKARNKDDISILEGLVQKLDGCIESVPLEKTEYVLANDGFVGQEEIRRTVQKDYFMSSPVIQIKAKESIAELKSLEKDVQETKTRLNDKIEKLSSPDLVTFLDALLTGVIDFSGNVIKYTEKNVFGDAQVLSQISEEYPYGEIPPYQAYISYQNMTSELKKEIRDSVAECRNNEDPQIAKSIKALSSLITDKRLGFWGALANNLAGREDIIDFLKALKERYDIFAEQYLE